MIAQLSVPESTFIKARLGYSKPGSSLTTEQRRDYSGHGYPDLEGIGEFPASVITPSLSASEVLEGLTDSDWSGGSLIEGVWTVNQRKRAKTQAEMDAGFAMAKAAKAAMVLTKDFAGNISGGKFAPLIAAGRIYTIPTPSDPASAGPRTYQIDSGAQANMTSVAGMFNLGVSNAHGGFWRAADNVDVIMTEAECKALFIDAGAYKAAIVRNMWALLKDITAAPNQAALDAIDIDAGTSANASGWPQNGGA